VVILSLPTVPLLKVLMNLEKVSASELERKRFQKSINLQLNGNHKQSIKYYRQQTRYNVFIVFVITLIKGKNKRF
jgi:hypothetical protein